MSVCINYFKVLCYADKIKAANASVDFENIFDYTKSFDGDMKNMFCSDFHYKLKRKLDDESMKKLKT